MSLTIGPNLSAILWVRSVRVSLDRARYSRRPPIGIVLRERRPNEPNVTNRSNQHHIDHREHHAADIWFRRRPTQAGSSTRSFRQGMAEEPSCSPTRKAIFQPRANFVPTGSDGTTSPQTTSEASITLQILSVATASTEATNQKTPGGADLNVTASHRAAPRGGSYRSVDISI